MIYNPKIDVIVPCYNVDKVVERCIRSIINQEYDNEVNIYLVNDGSTDKTLNILNQFSSYKNINIINHQNNRGLSAARNSGIRAGSSEIIFFLDSDMIVNKDWLKIHVSILADNNVVGVVGDYVLPIDKNPNELDEYLYDRRRGARQFGDNKEIKFSYFLFSNTSIKRYAFDSIGLFDENINSYGGEDTELAIRLSEKFPNAFRFSSKGLSQHCSDKTMKEFQKSMYDYGKINLPLLLKKYPKYKNDLGGQYIHSIKGYIIFNPMVRFLIMVLNIMINSYWIKRYLIVDAVMRGIRNTKITN